MKLEEFLAPRNGWHMLSTVDASLRRRHPPEGAILTWASRHRRAGSNGHSQEFCMTVATRRQQTHKGPTWRERLTPANWSDFPLPPNHDFFLSQTTSNMLLPPPAYPQLLSCCHISICPADFFLTMSHHFLFVARQLQGGIYVTTNLKKSSTRGFEQWQLIEHSRYKMKMKIISFPNTAWHNHLILNCTVIQALLRN